MAAPRLVFVTTAPLPYQTPVFNELAKRTDLHVLYMSKVERMNRFRDSWGEEASYDWSTFPSVWLRSHRADFRLQLSAGVSRRLAALDPEVVGVLSWHPVCVEPLLYAAASGRATLMWAESTSTSGRLRSHFTLQMRSALLRRVGAFVTNGTLATSFLGELGVAETSIVTSRLASHPAARTSRTGDQGRVQFLFVGRLIPRKHPVELIEAFRRMLDVRRDAHLTVIGEGPLWEACHEAAAPISDSVTLAGHLEGAALAHAYQRSDVLVLPAEREVWGLVVNEAIAHGLYVIATEQVGAARDLLSPLTGCTVAVEALNSLDKVMLSVATTVPHDDLTRERRAESISDVTFARFADDFYRAAVLALSKRNPPSRDARR